MIVIILLLSGCAGEPSTEASASSGSLPAGVIDSLARELPDDRPNIVFRETARAAGIDFTHSSGDRKRLLPEDMGSGAAWGDFDADGFPDLYAVNQPGGWGEETSKASPTNRLYRNNRDGTFTDVTAAAGVGDAGFGFGAFWGDYDNDGYPDLYVTNYGRSVLYHNGRDGTFRDVTDEAGVANNRWAAGAVWFDYDGDGLLDLYVCNYVDFDLGRVGDSGETFQYGFNVPFSLNPASFRPQANRLYRNQGGGKFVDVTAQAGVADVNGRSLVATFSDFDLDGLPDLYVGNDISDNTFYRNLGGGKFADESTESWTQEYRGTMGIAVGDPDHDSDMDMFLTHWVAQENAYYQNLWHELAAGERRVPRFTDSADSQGLGAPSLSRVGWGTAFADFDLDGRLDIFVANGSTIEHAEDKKSLIPQKPFLFWNAGEKGYFDLWRFSGASAESRWVGRGLACADYDNDGDIDCVLTVNRGRLLLLKNETAADNHWLKVRLRGTQSNRQGIGAKLWVTAGGVRRYREIGVGGSYLSQHFPEAVFGLGAADRVETLEVAWPSGARRKFEDLAANAVLLITEGSSTAIERIEP